MANSRGGGSASSGGSYYRVLAFDGGGIKGLYSAVLLRRLQAAVPKLLRGTQLLAGNSAGSLIALGAASGMTPEHIEQLFETVGADVFTNPRLPLRQPRYTNDRLHAILVEQFGAELQLSGLKQKVVVPSFRVISPDDGPWGPVLYNNFPRSSNKSTLVVDAAMASTAAPVYFPSYREHIDGGVFANNPCTAALSFAVDRKAGKQPLARVAMLSLGTGFFPYRINEDTASWGLEQWAFDMTPGEFGPEFPLLTVLMEGVTEVDTLYASQLLGSRFLRFNPPLPAKIPMDDADAVPRIKEAAESVDIGTPVRFLRKYWR